MSLPTFWLDLKTVYSHLMNVGQDGPDKLDNANDTGSKSYCSQMISEHPPDPFQHREMNAALVSRVGSDLRYELLWIFKTSIFGYVPFYRFEEHLKSTVFKRQKSIDCP